MAFTLSVTRGSDTTQLNDGNPFWLESAEGLSNADVVRLAQGGPQQQGVTDLGFRVQPRDFTLNVLFYASTDAALDGHRDTLMAAFRAMNADAVEEWFLDYVSRPNLVLGVTRDDGSTRTLVVSLAGEIEINLVPEERAAKLHRASIPLRAAFPFWEGDRSTLSVAIANWALVGGRLTWNELREHKNITTHSEWAGAGNITGDYAIALVTPDLNYNGTAAYNFESFYLFGGTPSTRLAYLPGSSGYIYNRATAAITDWPGGTASNYHVIENRSGTSYWRYWDGSALVTVDSHAQAGNLNTFGRWRSHYYDSLPANPGPITRGAIYRSVTLEDLTALAPYILGSVPYVLVPTVVGDMPVTPDITLTGPVTNPVLVNTTTGGSIDLTGLALAAGVTATLGLRYGNKTLTNSAGSSLMGSVTATPVGMADFTLMPDGNGQNIVELSGSGITDATQVSLSWTELYMSF